MLILHLYGFVLSNSLEGKHIQISGALSLCIPSFCVCVCVCSTLQVLAASVSLKHWPLHPHSVISGLCLSSAFLPCGLGSVSREKEKVMLESISFVPFLPEITVPCCLLACPKIIVSPICQFSHSLQWEHKSSTSFPRNGRSRSLQSNCFFFSWQNANSNIESGFF